MNAYPPVSNKAQKKARLRCLFLLPLYGFSAAHSLAFLFLKNGTGWIHGLAALTLVSFIAALTVFTYKIDLMTAVFRFQTLRRINPALLLSLALIVPLFVAATFAIQMNVRHENTILLTAGAVVNFPFMGTLMLGCLFGLRDPYWPAAFKKMLHGGA
jgi:hypothetical protein